MVEFCMDTTASDKDMGAYGTSLPTDLKSATKEIIFLRIENTDLRRTTDEQREQIRIMKAREYGRSSEKRTIEDIRQGKLFDEAELYASPRPAVEVIETVRITKTVYTRRKRGRAPISPKLARLEIVVDLGDEERASVP